MKVNTLYFIVNTILDNVRPGKLYGRLLKVRNQRVRAHQNAVVHMIISLYDS